MSKTPEAMTLKQIMSHYKNVRETKSAMGIGFIVNNNTCDYLEIYDLKHQEYRFIDDNFPGQKRFFSTNIPYTSLEQFEADITRMQIAPLIRKVPATHLPAQGEGVEKLVTDAWDAAGKYIAWATQDDANEKDEPLPFRDYLAKVLSTTPPAASGGEREKEINFDGNVLCKLKVTSGEVEVLAAMNGYGNSIPVKNITITDVTPSTEDK